MSVIKDSDKREPLQSVPWFSINKRNPGHWDIWVEERRVFVIRGAPGCYGVMNCPKDNSDNRFQIEFQTVGGCMAWVCDQLMTELIVAGDQPAQEVEAWNLTTK